MKAYLLIGLLFFLMSTGCNKDKEIRRLLNSDHPTERIEGAREAGETHDKQYVPLLLKDAYDPSASTSLKYKGYTVYTEVMFALEEIFGVKPPDPYKDILVSPDSVNVKFYQGLWRKDNKTHP